MSSSPLLPAQRWSELHGQRLAWAYRAYGEFINSLSKEVREHLVGDDGARQPYVVMFGPTQVGKTTLLLELMGVHEDARAGVSTVLRGGRAHGKSATATAMEYRRSPDHGWRIDFADGSAVQLLDNDAAMTAALSILRQRMEDRQLANLTPVVVWIPRDRFGTGEQQRLGVRILDLPGDHPAGQAEADHVAKMSKHYVAHADLVLLMGRSDNLGFLLPGALNLPPGIDDWQFAPSRFRVITTHSYTLGSERDMLRSHEGPLTTGLFRQRLLEQIATFGKPRTQEAAQPQRYYPLEFGDSWAQALRSDSEFTRRVGPIVEELKYELHADIAASATEEARFRNALDAHLVAHQKRKDYQRLAKEQLRPLAMSICKAKSMQRQFQTANVEADKAAARLDSLLAQRAEAESDIALLARLDLSHHEAKLENLDTNTSALVDLISNVQQDLRRHFIQFKPADKTCDLFGHPDTGGWLTKANRALSDQFDELLTRMAGYVIEEYYPSVSNSWRNDLKSLRLGIDNAGQAIGKLIIRLWGEQIAQRCAEWDEEAARHRAQAAAARQQWQRYNAQRQQLRAQHTDIKQQVQSQLARLAEDEKTSLRFSSLLNEAYCRELTTLRAELAAAPPVESLLLLLSSALLKEARAKIIPT